MKAGRNLDQYSMTSPIPHLPKEVMDEGVEFFKSKGKRKVSKYGNGQLVFHHRKVYWFVSLVSMKYAPRHKACQKWYYNGKELEDVWEGINGWCDFRDKMRGEGE